MKNLTKEIHLVTGARRHEAGKTRKVIVSVKPPAEVGARLQGTLQTFWLTAEEVYEVAVRKFVREVEREAARIARTDRVRLSTARARARQQLRKAGAK